MKSNGKQLQLDFKNCVEIYKPSSSIQMTTDEFSVLQLRQINSLMYCIINNLTFNPFDLKFDYIKKHKNTFKYVKYAIPFTLLKKHSKYTSRDNDKFLDPFRDLLDKKVTFNLLGKDKTCDMAFTAPLFTMHNSDDNIKKILVNKNEDYFYFTLNPIFEDMILEKKTVGTKIPLHNNFKSKYTFKLHELVLDYWNNDKFYMGTQNINDIAEILGSSKYLKISYSKWKQVSLNVAIKELNEKTDFNVEIDTEERISKDNRTISFKVSKKSKTIKSKISLPKNLQELYNKIKIVNKYANEDFDNVYMKDKVGNYVTLKFILDSKNELEKKDLVEKLLNLKTKDYFFSVEDRNKLNKIDIEKYKILFKNSIYEINSEYSRWFLVDDNWKKYDVIKNYKDDVGAGLNIDAIRLYFNNYVNAKNKNDYKLAYVPNDIVDITNIEVKDCIFFGIKAYDLDNQILKIEDYKQEVNPILAKQELFNYLLNAIRIGIKTYDQDQNEILINNNTFLKNIDIFKSNLANKKYDYFKFVDNVSDDKELQGYLRVHFLDVDEFVDFFNGKEI
jgi:hypothetical protein